MTVDQATAAPAIPLPPLTRVVVVGAGGASGVVAVQQLLEAGVPAGQILAYEARDRAGGLWNYTADTGDLHVDWRAGALPRVLTSAEVEGEVAPSGELESRLC